jgi:predicted DNA-binding protein
MATMKGKRILASLYIDPPVHRDLKRLSKATDIPVAVYLREAVDDLLRKHATQLRRAGK